MLVRWITPLGHHLAVPNEYIPLMVAPNHCRLWQRTCQIRKMCLIRIFIIRCALLFVHFKVSMCYYGTILSVSTMGSPTSLLPSPIQRGGMGGISFGRCAILIGPQTHSLQHFRALAKGWVDLDPKTQISSTSHSSNQRIRASTTLEHSPLVTKDTACPRITIASRNWHHLMPGICTSWGGPSTHP